MPIPATHLTTGKSDTDSDSFSSASIAPSGNALIIIAVLSRAVSGDANIPTVTGNGITYSLITPIIDGNRLTLFRGMAASPTAGAVTFDFAGQNQQYCHWSITEFTSVDTSGSNGAGAVVQSETNKATTTNTGLTVTLAAFANANNATFGAVRAGETVTPGSGFSELGETSGEAILQTEWKNSADTSVDWTWPSTGAFALGAAIEIKGILSSTLTEAATLTDSLIRSTSRTLIDTSTLTDQIITLKIKAYEMVLEGIALADSIIRSLTRTITDAATLADTALKSASRTLSDSAVLTDTFTKTLTYVRTLIESLPFTDYIASYLNGLAARYSRKYSDQGTTYSSKYESQGTEYDKKYPPN